MNYRFSSESISSIKYGISAFDWAELLRIELQRKSKGISRTPQDALTPYLTRSTNSLSQKSFFHEP